MVFLPTLWPLRFLNGEKSREGLVLGAANQKNLSLSVQSLDGRDQVTVRALVFRNQRSVYHNIFFVENREGGAAKRFFVADPQILDPKGLVGESRVYFYKNGPSEDVMLDDGERAAVSMEVVTKDDGPASYNIELRFSVLSL